MTAKLKLIGKVAIVTGAGRGIGKEIALTLAANGAKVVLASRSVDELDSVREEIALAGGSAISVLVDIGDSSQVHNLVDSTARMFSKIDILVNNAATVHPIGSIMDISEKDWMDAVQTNLFGTFLCIKAAVPIMIRNGGGKIVNLSGGGAFNPFPNFSAYSTSKAAIVRLTETLAAELADRNIQLNCIAPGMVHTRMVDEIRQSGLRAGNEYQKRVEREIDQGNNHAKNAAELALMLVTSNLSGRTISAIWDKWREFPGKESIIMRTDLFTMKRITPEDRPSVQI